MGRDEREKSRGRELVEVRSEVRVVKRMSVRAERWGEGSVVGSETV